MKLFGGGRASAPSKTAPREKKPKKRALIIVLAVLIALCCALGAAYVWFFETMPGSLGELHRPEQGETVKPGKPDKTGDGDAPMTDIEAPMDEGDMPDIDMGGRKEGVYTFLVCATDIDGTRTDAIMCATLDTVGDTLNVINIPRDTMSNVGRTGASKKINAAYGLRGGIEQTKKEVKKILGFTPDKYVVLSFDAIAEIVEAIGGVDYEIPWRMYYKDPSQKLSIDFKPGMTHLDGQEAVEFMRWRKNNGGVKTGSSSYTGGDEQRIEKDQKFLKHLAGEVFTIKNVTKIPAFVQIAYDNVKTDLTSREMLWFARQVYDVKNEDINMMTLPGHGTMSYAGTPTMYSFFFPYRNQTLEMVNTYLNPYLKNITNIDVISSADTTSFKKQPVSGGGSSSVDPESGESVPAVDPETPVLPENPDGGGNILPDEGPGDLIDETPAESPEAPAEGGGESQGPPFDMSDVPVFTEDPEN